MKEDAELMRAHELGMDAVEVLPQIEDLLEEQQRLIDRAAYNRIDAEGSISPDEALRYWYTKHSLARLPAKLRKQAKQGARASEQIGNMHKEGT